MLLRQNPHNVHEWHKRAKLFASDPRKAIVCYTEAVKTVDPKKALGKPHSLWIAFAKYVRACMGWVGGWVGGWGGWYGMGWTSKGWTWTWS